ncbi:hypothetical protein DES53_10989 [Roseimicrobium gellanilyticum]|uniref:Leucine rich repeat (LRR) protein n=1 Tax=Roseimicrobium gellanilyticum TaxID=748857 RepID=A0A366HBC0_9BACT|nr:hypothetical protein [Roseimicrobium gellanilyticum]RBP39662.1 hypothetical protein DES53_10989 [Roseimicrobium gellanilyticum]
MKCVCTFLVLLLALAAVRADTIGDYTFELDGAPLEPGLITTEGENPVPGDVAFVAGFKLCLDGPGTYAFIRKYDGLYRKLDDGRVVMVACEVEERKAELEGSLHGPPSPRTMINPLTDMDATALKNLRGVTLTTWPEAIEKHLAKLDWEHVCLSVEGKAVWQFGEKMPPIPTEVRTLMVESGGSWHCTDMSPFLRLQKLRFLDLRQASTRHFDLSVLRGLPLEYLGLPWPLEKSDPEALGSLTALKTLVADYCDYIGEARWLAKLQNLRVLHASHAFERDGTSFPPLDLAAIKHLPKLTELHVQDRKVANLPDVSMPSLKSAFLLQCSAPPKAIEAFVKANPQARIHKSMNEELAKELQGVDKLRARSGGVRLRGAEEVKTIHETRDVLEIQELAKNFAVSEVINYGHCNCLGDLTFECYKGEELVAVIGFHHGRSIRWLGGTWPSDGILTGSSAHHLTGWLAKHGYKDPHQLAEERSLRRAAALRRQQEIYATLLPPALDRSKLTTSTEDDALAEFEKHFPTVQARAALYLKLFGCGQGPWEMASPLDQLLARVLLPYLPKEVLHEAIKSAKPGSMESLGALRWVFGEEHAKEWRHDQVTLERLARQALSDPHSGNRWLTLAVLRDVESPEALQVLRSVLKDGTKPSPKSKEAEYEEYAYERIYQPSALKLPAGTPDQTVAALCLRMLRDKESAAEVEKIYQQLGAETKQAWDEILGEK